MGSEAIRRTEESGAAPELIFSGFSAANSARGGNNHPDSIFFKAIFLVVKLIYND
jgi:hypothetical protein